MEVADELAKGVQNIAMESKVPDLNAQAPGLDDGSVDRISGLDSFASTLGDSASAKADPELRNSLSIRERLQLRKEQMAGSGGEKDVPSVSLPGAVKNIDKQKNKKGTKTGIADSIRELGKNGVEVAKLLESLQKDGESPAKRKPPLKPMAPPVPLNPLNKANLKEVTKEKLSGDVRHFFEEIWISSPSSIIPCSIREIIVEAHLNPLMEVNIMPWHLAYILLGDVTLKPFDKLIKSCPFGDILECRGVAGAVMLSIDKIEVNLDFHIFDILDLDLLLGYPLEKLLDTPQGSLDEKLRESVSTITASSTSTTASSAIIHESS
ncbi:hypothetical protein C2845_PM07G10630 [Panicum miliaceum]|uniref:Uncharacterized protein n=1 Tax=Panicum miliaceum TaxID=4540 RepID=A0A3L6SR19_PANMI|nr:hypothetical protein C2845_PM07G10630 [Panicum miliaceum]